jgi:hypothetical protein
MKRATLRRGYLALALGAALSARAQVGELLVIQETGPRDKRVNMVLIGDGYTAAEKSKFIEHARVFSKGVVEDPPLTGYARYFNVYAIFVASNQSGADIPTQGISRDTYFNANYDASLGRLLVIDFAKGFGVIDLHVPERDIPVAIVNSSQYGGSGGPIAVANYTAPEIIAHEVQHSFTNLGDEYDYPGVQPWEAPNTTQRTQRTLIPWTHWIAASTPVPTPEVQANANLIGLFEGAAYNTTGWYRPKMTCRMKENAQPFCGACSEAILLQVYDRVSPLDSALPLQRAVNAGADPAVLRVVVKQPTTHSIKVEWWVDGQAHPQAGPIFNQGLPVGRHRVVARVSDPTPMVRKDAAGVLRDSAWWDVTVTQVSGTRAAVLSGSLEIGALAGGNLDFRLPADGAYRLSAFAPDGRRLWGRAGSGRAGANSLPLPGHSQDTRNPGSTPKGLVLLRLEQGGLRAEARVLDLD